MVRSNTYRNAFIVTLALIMSACGGVMKQLERPSEPAPITTVAPPAAMEPVAPEPVMPIAIAAMPAPIAIEAPPPPRVALAPRPSAPRNPGRYFQTDGPGDIPPEALQNVAEPTPRHEPLAAFANQPYTALGQHYTPAKTRKATRQRGVASWYGKQFHGRKTSTGERYDMYALTAAHPTLPLPSYVRVTNVANKRSIVVRVNDRGPFTGGRILDLSYAAAAKLGFVRNGSAQVEVETILPAAPTVVAMRSP